MTLMAVEAVGVLAQLVTSSYLFPREKTAQELALLTALALFLLSVLQPQDQVLDASFLPPCDALVL